MIARVLLILLCVSFYPVECMVKIKEDNKTYALRVVPQLKNMLVVELTSFLKAYAQFFDDLDELFDAQDKAGNTLLHNIMMFSDNTELFYYLVTMGAAVDIPNNKGLTVMELFDMKPLFKSSHRIATGRDTLKEEHEPLEEVKEEKVSKKKRTRKKPEASPVAKKRISFVPEEAHAPISLSDASLVKKFH